MSYIAICGICNLPVEDHTYLDWIKHIDTLIADRDMMKKRLVEYNNESIEKNKERDLFRAQLEVAKEVMIEINNWLGTDDAAHALPFEPPWYEKFYKTIAKLGEKK